MIPSSSVLIPGPLCPSPNVKCLDLTPMIFQFAQQGPQWAGNFAPLPDNEQIPGCTGVSDGNHYHVRNVQVRNEGWLNRNRFFIRCQGERFHLCKNLYKNGSISARPLTKR